MRKLRHCFSILAIGLAVLLGALPAHAQSVQGTGQGGELLRAGENALGKGQFRVAVRHFSKALRSDGLSDAQVAKALYQRGVAHEKSGKPAQAIADITNALFLPGLSDADRAKAYLSRGRAYEAVGMSDLARSDISRAKSGGVSEQQIARSNQPARSGSGSKGPAFATKVESASGRSTGPSFATNVEPAGAVTPRPAFTTRSSKPSSRSGSQKVASFETQTRPAASGEESIPRFRTSILPQDNASPAQRVAARDSAPPAGSPGSGWNTATNSEQQAPASVQKNEAGSGVKSFFGNLWSKATGGSDDKKQADSVPPSPTPQTAPQWNQTTNVARAPAPSWNAKVTSPGPPSTPAQPARTIQPPAAPSGGSGYRIQLAALRSDAEANATWKRLQSRHKDLLAGRKPNIVKTELGGLGTFYRVQLGPFADKSSSQQLCASFKSGGLDCFLLAP